MKQANYSSANVETSLYRALKAYASKRGLKIKFLISEAIRTYLETKSQEDKAS